MRARRDCFVSGRKGRDHMQYVLSCCSTADLTKEQLEERNIRYIYFHYEMDGVQYPDDLGQTMPFDKFYQAMADGADTKTSQVNVDEFLEYFRPMLAAGQDVVHCCLSSGISGVYNAAASAQKILAEEFPDRKLYVVDTLCASGGFGLMMFKLAELRDAGLTAEELVEWIMKHRLEMQHWFFSMDLTFFVKGGRISKASGWFGTVLNICPLMNVDNKGGLVPRYKLRGKKKAIEASVNKMLELAQDRENYSGQCLITNAACYEDARALADLIEQKFPRLNGRVIINSIGTTIGSHTGPGTVAFFFWGDERTA